jgi:hypothetical protein
MDDVEEDYKIEKMKRFQKSLMSLLLSLFIVPSLLKNIKYLNLFINI